MRFYQRYAYRWMQEWDYTFATQSPPEELIDNMEEWKHTLSSFKNFQIIPVEKSIERIWSGDTWALFEIIIGIGEFWSCHKQTRISSHKNLDKEEDIS